MLNEILPHLSSDDDHRRWYADQIELLIRRLCILEADDRTVMQAYLEHNVSVQQIARLTGENPKAIRGRVKRFMRQLYDGDFLELYRRRRQFSPVEMKVGYDRFMLGLGHRAIAEKRRLTVKQVRSAVDKIHRRLGRPRRHDPDAGRAGGDKNIRSEAASPRNDKW